MHDGDRYTVTDDGNTCNCAILYMYVYSVYTSMRLEVHIILCLLHSFGSHIYTWFSDAFP